MSGLGKRVSFLILIEIAALELVVVAGAMLGGFCCGSFHVTLQMFPSTQNH
jgi:hypothetical protein